MKTWIPFLIVIVGLVSSCQKQNDGLTFNERRVVGEWKYDKVTFLEDWSVKRADETSQYDEIILTFKPDFTAGSVNTETGEELEGLWELSEVFTGDSECVNLYVSLQNKESGTLSQVVFENASLFKNRINSTYRTSDGNFRYVLRRN